MRILGHHPTRRRLLATLGLAVVGLPAARLLQKLRRERRRHPRDLSPIPWIGHC